MHLIIVVVMTPFIGTSLFFRRRSKLYAILMGVLGIAPAALCTPSFVASDDVFAPIPLGWAAALIAFLALVPWQMYVFKHDLGRVTAGLIGDTFLFVIVFFALMVLEMFVTADGGPGFPQYGPTTIVSFLAVEFAAPPLLERFGQKEFGLPRGEAETSPDE